MLAAFFNGAVISGFQIHDIIAKKALDALDWQVTILVMLWPVSNLFSIWWGKILERSQNISKFFILTSFVGRLSLVLMLWVSGYYSYLILMVLLFSFNSLISPAQNSIYQHNIRPQNRGTVFGYFSSITTLVLVISSFISGKILDINEELFRYIFFTIGLFGFISTIFMALIQNRKTKEEVKEKQPLLQLFLQPIKRSFEVLKKNHDFALFERNFFIYGIGFIIILPVLPSYLVDYLQMDYSQTFLGKAILSQLGILFLAPFTGKIFDKKNPAYFTFLAFATLSIYPLTLFISSFFIGTSFVNYIVYLAFLIFGIAMSAILISWNISSIYFAGEEDASMYQSVHVTLTGIRGILVPFIGYFIMKFFTVRTVFILSALCLLTASILSYKLYLHMDYKPIKIHLKARQMLANIRKLFPVR
jgi:MFS family permease